MNFAAKGVGLRDRLRKRLSEREREQAPAGSGDQCAVLVPLFEHQGDTFLWLVRRPDTMRQHSGQVAFPGGKRDASDESLLSTALRETHEEVGIAPSAVDVLGPLDDVVTITGFVITPYVGWLGNEIPVPNPTEVARVFAAPLQAFLDAPQTSFSRMGITIEGEFVWGATAAITRALCAIVRELTDGRQYG